MNKIYVITGIYSHPSFKFGSQTQSIAFKTLDEAERYCAYHSTRNEFYFFSEVEIGKFHKEYKGNKHD